MSTLFKNRKFTIAAFLAAGSLWLIGSSTHYFVHEEPQFEFIPSDANELWMRVIIIGIIILIGVFSDWATCRESSVQKDCEKIIWHKEKIDDIESEISNLQTSQNMFRMRSMEKAVVDEDFNTLYDKAVDEKLDEAVATLDSLLEMEDITNKKN